MSEVRFTVTRMPPRTYVAPVDPRARQPKPWRKHPLRRKREQQRDAKEWRAKLLEHMRMRADVEVYSVEVCKLLGCECYTAQNLLVRLEADGHLVSRRVQTGRGLGRRYYRLVHKGDLSTKE